MGGVSLVVLSIQIIILVVVLFLTSHLSGHGAARPPARRGNDGRGFELRHPQPALSKSARTSAIQREFRLPSSHRPVQTFDVRREDWGDSEKTLFSHSEGEAGAVRYEQEGLKPVPDRSARVRPGRLKDRRHLDDIRSRLQTSHFNTDVKMDRPGAQSHPPVLNCGLHDHGETQAQNQAAFPTLACQGQQEKEEMDPIPCGEGLCRCYNVTADCSSQPGHLTYIPVLPSSILFLNLSNNALGAIPTDLFFANVTQIKGLDLSWNSLSFFSPAAFRMFSGGLKELYLGNNPSLNFSSLAPVLSIQTLTWLDLNENHLGFLPTHLFRRFPLPALVNLNLNGNDFYEFHLSALIPLRSLRFLELVDNSIQELTSTSVVASLQSINLAFNMLSDFPETCFNGKSLFPRLEHLRLDWNMIRSVPEDVCLPQLQYLSLRQNIITQVGSGWFSPERFTNLHALSLDLFPDNVVVKAGAFRNPNLRLLTLGGNSMSLPARSSFDPDMLTGCTNLTSLSINMNMLAGTDLRRLVGHLKSLRFLDLSADSLGLCSFDCQAFSELNNLASLRLQGNKISSLPDACFDQLPALLSLELDENNIDTVDELVFGRLTRKRLQSLDLSGNPFFCDERLAWLCRWMESDPELFANPRDSYGCANMPNTTFMDYCKGELWVN